MQVHTVGGGPGGLYASLLLKQERPDWEVVVHERNPADVTYGWGIVFPSRTLSNLEAADPASHRAITEAFTRWEPFDTWVGGERYRMGGHTFASMMRTDLLAILQERCREVGVDLRFEDEVTDPQALAAEADLLLAADGIHSPTREAYAAELGTELVQGTARFSWFGTDADFEALSHIFVENDDGIWCAHTYPGPTSTFIVDCDAETWANSGLAEADEATYLAYLEDAFADHLDGQPLRSEQDRWRRFTTVTNERWHHGNVALVGDAAHTAHYSIGSGTTMAMEDAIGLARAFADHDDRERALTAYERSRKPAAQTLQRAGERSRVHFEHIRRFFDQPGRQFTVHHLTRSGRLTYGSLRRRDPGFVAAHEREFAARAPGGPSDSAAVDDPAPPRAQPFDLRDLRLANRAVAPCPPTSSAVDGAPDATQVEALAARATRGASLVLAEPLAVDPDGRHTRGSPGLYEDAHADAWREGVEGVDSSDVATGAVLTHAGRRAGEQPGSVAGLGGGRGVDESPAAPSPVGPSPVAYDDGWPTPTPMDRDAMAGVRSAFVAAAERADAAGFDLLVIDAGGGSLLSQFLSPLANRREDEYGGPLENRVRFPGEVVGAVRETWPDGKPLGVRLQARDRAPGGLTLEDAFTAAADLDDRGVDLVAPVAGGQVPHETPDELRGPLWDSDDLRHEVGVPTLSTGSATTADDLDTAVGTARADLCAFDGRLRPDPAGD